jgi:hypothetical protein
VKTRADESVARPAESLASATVAGATSAASASGPPNEASATLVNAQGASGRAAALWRRGPVVAVLERRAPAISWNNSPPRFG